MRIFTDRSGAIAVTTGLLAVPLVGMAALATDAVLWQTQRLRLQSVADVAAFSAGVEFANGGVVQNAQTQAYAVAAGLGYPSAEVAVNIPPRSGPNSGNAHAVEVVVTIPVSQFFSGVLLNAAGASIKGRAVAAASSVSTCYYDPNGNDTTGGATGLNFTLTNNEVLTLPDMNGKVMTVSGWGTVNFAHDANGATLTISSSCIGVNDVTHDFNGSRFIDNATPPAMNFVSVVHNCNGCTFTNGHLVLGAGGGAFNVGHDANGSSFTFVTCASCSASGSSLGNYALVE